MRRKKIIAGVKKLEDVNFDLKKYEQLNRKEQEETLWENIERIAKNETKVYIASFFFPLFLISYINILR